MLNIALASMALMATSALAQGGVGTARVVNMCKYPVHLFNTPASGGGFTDIIKTLTPGGKYEQQWLQLSNDQGWSIKLAKESALGPGIPLLQYEYTFHNDGIIWYDLSEVDGNPWDKNWEIISDGNDCTPKQQAYRFATDDAYGMQSCPASSEITVVVCSGESDDSGSGSPVESAASSVESAASSVLGGLTGATSEASWTSAPAVRSPEPAPSTTEAQAAPTTAAASSWGHHRPSWGGVNNRVQVEASSSPTTLSTAVKSPEADQGYDVTVTQIDTAIVTAYVTATAPAKRHEHHQRHPHRRHDA